MREPDRAVVLASLGNEPDPALRDTLANGPLRVLGTHGSDETLRVLDDSAADATVVVSTTLDETVIGLLRELQARWPSMPVILITGATDADRIAAALEHGASDLLLEPVNAEQLLFSVRKALASVARTLTAPPPPRSETAMVFGRSPAMQALRELIEQVAASSSTALVRGESGTGKELVARALHRLSPRAGRPFIKIDCTALPETLIESELFGYERGAFTGAATQKLGRVQLADRGTLFLDEVGELPLPVQAKLLRLLQDREFDRLGGKTTLRVDVRLVAATHRDLETMVERGSFRQDLFYRLNVVPLWIPPLRSRRSDVRELAEHFCAVAGANSGKPTVCLSSDALEVLARQRWNGNVRQLENFVERLVVLARGANIDAKAVEAELARPVRFVTESGIAGADAPRTPAGMELASPLDEALRVAEKLALSRALEQASGNRSAAARLLGVSRSGLYTKLREYGLI